MKLVIIIIFLIVSGWCDDTSDAEFIFSSNRIVRSIVEADHTERLHAMLVLGVNPDMISHAQIPLVLHAAVVQNVAAMKELCEFGANVNVVEADGWTPLMLTAGTGNLEMINLLLEWNGNPFMSNYAGDTALTIANMHNHNEVETRLLEGCVNYAVNEGQFELLIQAIAAGGNVNQIINGNNDQGYTPLIYLCSEGSVQDVKVFLELYSDYVDINQLESDGWNCADFAISRVDTPLQKVLEAAGATPKKLRQITITEMKAT